MRVYKLSCVIFIILACPSYVLANECKVTVGFTNNTLGSNDNITRYEKYRVRLGSSLAADSLIKQHNKTNHRNSKKYLKHMRKVWNSGSYGLKITYWEGKIDLRGNKVYRSRIVEKGAPLDSTKISGDLNKIECLRPRSTSSCKLKGYFASGPLNPFHSGSPINYDVNLGSTQGARVERKHLRKMVNTGNIDARIEVRGIGPATWKRLNPGDEFIGQTDIQAIHCIGGSSPKLSPIDKMKEDIDNARQVYTHYRDTWGKIDKLVNKDGEVVVAPPFCKLDSSKNIYENRYIGTTTDIGSRKNSII